MSFEPQESVDSKFEEFLNESLSTDEVDEDEEGKGFAGGDNQKGRWSEDSTSEGGVTPTFGRKKNFLKKRVKPDSSIPDFGTGEVMQSISETDVTITDQPSRLPRFGQETPEQPSPSKDRGVSLDTREMDEADQSKIPFSGRPGRPDIANKGRLPPQPPIRSSIASSGMGFSHDSDSMQKASILSNVSLLDTADTSLMEERSPGPSRPNLLPTLDPSNVTPRASKGRSRRSLWNASMDDVKDVSMDEEDVAAQGDDDTPSGKQTASLGFLGGGGDGGGDRQNMLDSEGGEWQRQLGPGVVGGSERGVDAAGDRAGRKEWLGDTMDGVGTLDGTSKDMAEVNEAYWKVGMAATGSDLTDTSHMTANHQPTADDLLEEAKTFRPSSGVEQRPGTDHEADRPTPKPRLSVDSSAELHHLGDGAGGPVHPPRPYSRTSSAGGGVFHGPPTGDSQVYSSHEREQDNDGRHEAPIQEAEDNKDESAGDASPNTAPWDLSPIYKDGGNVWDLMPAEGVQSPDVSNYIAGQGQLPTYESSVIEAGSGRDGKRGRARVSSPRRSAGSPKKSRYRRGRGGSRKEDRSDRSEGEETWMSQERRNEGLREPSPKKKSPSKSRSRSPTKAPKKSATKAKVKRSTSTGRQSHPSPVRSIDDIARYKQYSNIPSKVQLSWTSTNRNERKPSSAGPTESRRRDENQQYDVDAAVRDNQGRQLTVGKKPVERRDVWSPAKVMERKIRGTEVLYPNMGDIRPENLKASIDSFTDYLQDHFGSEPPKQAPRGRPAEDRLAHYQRPVVGIEEEGSLAWKGRWEEERKRVAKLEAALRAGRGEVDTRLRELEAAHHREMQAARQENLTLSAKLSVNPAASETVLLHTDGPGPESEDERRARMEKEVREQEGLLRAYEKENERLYKEVKAIRLTCKETEEKRTRETQALQTQVNKLRQELERKESHLVNRGLITGKAVQQQIAASGGAQEASLGAGRIAELTIELKQCKIRIEEFAIRESVWEKSQNTLQNRLEELVKGKDRFLTAHEGCKLAHEIQTIEEKHRRAVNELERKIRWHVENQALLDRDSAVIKEKDDKISDLEKQLAHINTQTGRRQHESKLRVKERASDAKRIQDLERQVRELESVIRKRHPNSLPALVLAAAAASPGLNESGGDNSNIKPLPTVQFLEGRVKRLEAALDEKDSASDKSMRLMEQRFEAMKLKYEAHTAMLEAQLENAQKAANKNGADGDRPFTTAMALQRELESVRDKYRKKIANKDVELETLRKRMNLQQDHETAVTKRASAALRESGTLTNAKVFELEEKVTVREADIANLLTTVDRLQKEKRVITEELNLRNSTAAVSDGAQVKKTISGKGGAKVRFKLGSKQGSHSNHTQSSNHLDGKTVYSPGTFQDAHVGDVMAENVRLKEAVKGLELSVSEAGLGAKKEVAMAESARRKEVEQLIDEMEKLRTAHQREVKNLNVQILAASQTSDLARLQKCMEDQQMLLDQLLKERESWRDSAEELSTLRIKEITNEAKLQALKDKLLEAKTYHTPEMRHFETLQSQLISLEARYKERTHQLTSIASGHYHGACHCSNECDGGDNSEVEHWKAVVRQKEKDIETFRIELDSMLSVLRELQRQGITVPMVGLTAS